MSMYKRHEIHRFFFLDELNLQLRKHYIHDDWVWTAVDLLSPSISLIIYVVFLFIPVKTNVHVFMKYWFLCQIEGDLGQTEWTAATLAQIKSQDYDVFLLPGDLSYADTNQPLWDSFGRLVEPLASKRPWMVTQGNHEIEFFPIIEHTTFKSYNSRWLMPYTESLSESNLYYSFDVAGIHTIMLGSYTDFDSESDQYQWLQADLAKVSWDIMQCLVHHNHFISLTKTSFQKLYFDLNSLSNFRLIYYLTNADES